MVVIIISKSLFRKSINLYTLLLRGEREKKKYRSDNKQGGGRLSDQTYYLGLSWAQFTH